MARIPRRQIEQILERTDLAALIGARVELKNIGTDRMRGLCPFHQEKTPSFTVYQQSHSYHCFGCKANGTAIDWVMSQDGLSYQEAVQQLAKQCGIDISYQTDEEEKTQEEIDPKLALLEETAAYFQQALADHPQAPTARQYLQQRGVDEKMRLAFRLGFAPPGWDNLVQLWQKNENTLALARELGLLKTKREGEVGYDAFRERLIFPICDFRGRVVGFGGRSLHADQTPKYLNSSDSSVFTKGSLVYGQYQARKASTVQSWLIVEGYMDVISLHQHGFTNAVACLGTAITEQQIHHLLRIAKTLCFVFDGDDAGRNAAIKAMKLCKPLLNPRNEFTFVLLPKGEDPDSLLAAHGSEYLRNYFAKHTFVWSDFFHQWVIKSADSSTVEGRMRILALAEKELDALESRDMRSILLTRIRAELGIGYLPKRAKKQRPQLPQRISKRSQRHQTIALKLLVACMHSPKEWAKIKHRSLEDIGCMASAIAPSVIDCLKVADELDATVHIVGLLNEHERQQFTDLTSGLVRSFTSQELEELVRELLQNVFREVPKEQRLTLLQAHHNIQKQRHAVSATHIDIPENTSL